MSLSKNSDYKKVLSTAAIIGATMFTPTYGNDIEQKLILKASYDQYTDYSSKKQTTAEDSSIKNDVEMLKWLEIGRFNELILAKYDSTITDFWEPAEGLLEKTCLFIKIEKQEELNLQVDLELELYILLEERLNESNFFNMIALL
jgi:hypothetical protein